MSTRIEAWRAHFGACGGCRSRLDGRSLTLCDVGEPLAVSALVSASEPKAPVLRTEMVRDNAIPIHDALATLALEVEDLATRAGKAGEAYQHTREALRSRTLGALYKSGMDTRDRIKAAADVVGNITATLSDGDGFIDDAKGLMRVMGERV